MRLATPGFYDISDADYHADPSAEPSASASLLAVALDKTLADAWWHHPRYNGEFAPDDNTSFDLGSVAHALVLGAGPTIEPLPYDDWRKDIAKAERGAALLEGKLPCLQRVYDQASEMHEALRGQLSGTENSPAFSDEGIAEQTALWHQETDFGPLPCRAKLDWRHKTEGLIYDYKTFAPGADPANFGKYLFREYRALQDPFYSMGVAALLSLNWTSEVSFRYVVQSPEPPYVASVVQLDDDARELAWRQTVWALNQWAGAAKQGRWPGYRPRTHFISAPPWGLTDWDNRMAADEHAEALDRRSAA